MTTACAVLGANFGDEGKGLVVDWVCAQQDPDFVVRHSGGANAGHTVVSANGRRHVFHHIGAGSLRGVPTFLSRFFVVNPILFVQELRAYRAAGHPRVPVFVDPEALVTTFVDMLENQRLEQQRRHGSCGVGVHQTMQREDQLRVKDLLHGGTIDSWLAQHCEHHGVDKPAMAEQFLRDCQEFANTVFPMTGRQLKFGYRVVFEGSQGLLLDQDQHAYFPHVTHAKTGSHNVRILCAEAGIEDRDLTLYYVSRTYLTRHGAGPLPGEDSAMRFADDTNVPHPFQGTLRFAPLDATLYTRVLQDAQGTRRKLVLTHCDQLLPPDTVGADYYFFGPTAEHLDEGYAKTHQEAALTALVRESEELGLYE